MLASKETALDSTSRPYALRIESSSSSSSLPPTSSAAPAPSTPGTRRDPTIWIYRPEHHDGAKWENDGTLPAPISPPRQWKTFTCIFPVRATSGESTKIEERSLLPDTARELNSIVLSLDRVGASYFPEKIADLKAKPYNARTFLEILEKDPYLLHFTGHGEKGQLVLDALHARTDAVGHILNVEDVEKTPDSFFVGQIATKRRSNPSLACVFLNCCHSFTLGRKLVAHVPYIVCWEGKLAKPTQGGGTVDSAVAFAFAQRFYEAIAIRIKEHGVEGVDIREAFASAVNWASTEGNNDGFDVKIWRPRLCVNEQLARAGTQEKSRVAVELSGSSSSSSSLRKCAPPRSLVGRSFVDGLRGVDLEAVTKMLLVNACARDGASKTTIDSIYSRHHQITTCVGVHGLNGMGGLGKSTLAAQLCWRVDAVRERFEAGGIFWLTASAENVLGELRKLLHDILAMHVLDADAASEAMACVNEKDALEAVRAVFETRWPESERKPVLIVLDDVWTAARVDALVPIDPLPQGSAVLMTYRRKQIGYETNATSSYALRSLTRESARALFANKSDVSLEDVAVSRVVDTVVKRLGMHPMALAIVGRLARRRLEGRRRDVERALMEVAEELRDGYLGGEEEEEEEEEGEEGAMSITGEAWVRRWLASIDMGEFYDPLVAKGCKSKQIATKYLRKSMLSSIGIPDLCVDLIMDSLADVRRKDREQSEKRRDREQQRREKERTRRHECVRACIGMSVNDLKSKRAKQLLLSMAVFPEDTSVPVGVLKAAFAEELRGGGGGGSLRRDLDELVDACVLEREDLGSKTVYYRLHDLCRDYVVGETKATLGKMQVRFVEAFQDDDDAVPLAAWRSGGASQRGKVVDDFVADHLCWHLRDAAKRGERKWAGEMLARIGTSVSWLEARLRRGGVGKTLKDLGIVCAEGPEACRWQAGLVASAIGMSNQELARRPWMLAEHLWQRLVVHVRKGVSLRERSVQSLLKAWINGPVTRRRAEVSPLCWVGPPKMKAAGGPLLRTLVGHKSSVRCVTTLTDLTLIPVFGGSGTYVVSGGGNTIRIWEPVTGRCVKAMCGHTSRHVNSIAILKDPRGRLRHALISSKKAKRGCDIVPTGSNISDVDNNCSVESLRGAFLVSGDDDATIRLWDPKIGKAVLAMRGHVAKVTTVAILKDPNFCLYRAFLSSERISRDVCGGLCGSGDSGSAFVVSGSDDGTIRLWNPLRGDQIMKMKTCPGQVRKIIILEDPNGRLRGTLRLSGKLKDNCGRGDGAIRLHRADLKAMGGAFVVSTSDDLKIRLWDPRSGKTIVTMTGHTKTVTSVTILEDPSHEVRRALMSRRRLAGGDFCSNDSAGDDASVCGAFVISASLDKTIRLWDPRSGKAIITIKRRKSARSVAMFKDPSTILYGTLLSSKRSDGTHGASRHGDTGNDGSDRLGRALVVSSDQDNTLRFWDLLTAKKISKIRAGNVTSISVLDDPRGRLGRALMVPRTISREVANGVTGGICDAFVVSGSSDGRVRLWDPQSCRVIARTFAQLQSVRSIAFLDDPRGCLRRALVASGKLHSRVDDDFFGGMVVVSGRNREYETIRLCDRTTGQTITEMKGAMHTKLVSTILPDPKGRLRRALAMSGKLLSRSDESGVADIDGGDDSDRFGAFVVSGGSDGKIRLWDPTSGRTVLTMVGHRRIPVNSVAILEDPKGRLRRALVVSRKLKDEAAGDVISSGLNNVNDDDSVCGVFVLSGCGDKIIRLWDTRSGNEIVNMKGHTYPVLSVAILKDRNGRLFRTLVSSGKIDICAHSAASGSHVAKSNGDFGCVFAVSGSSDWTVRLWNVVTGLEIWKMKGHKDGVNSVAVLEDSGGHLRRALVSSGRLNNGDVDGGAFVVSGSDDTTVRLWDPRSGKLVVTMAEHTGKVTSVAILEDPKGRLHRALATSGKQLDVVDYSDDAGIGGAIVISGSLDGTIRLWDPRSGRCIYTHTFSDGIQSFAVQLPSPSSEDSPIIFHLSVGLANGHLALFAYTDPHSQFFRRG